MWISVVISVVLLNVMLFIINRSGPKAIIATWVPVRAIIIAVSMLHSDNLNQWLEITWASSIIPVSFLAVFHFALRYLSHHGGLPRFSCAVKQWAVCWILAISVLALTIFLCFYTYNTYALFSIGILAAYLNTVNVIDAPEHLHKTKMSFTLNYIVAVNAMVVGVLIAINILIEHEQVAAAGIGGSLPLLAITLLAGSTCSPSEQTLKTSTSLLAGSTYSPSEQALKTSTQHVYMLAYQTWPSMVFVGVLRMVHSLGDYTAIALSTGAMLSMLIIQFVMIKDKL